MRFRIEAVEVRNLLAAAGEIGDDGMAAAPERTDVADGIVAQKDRLVVRVRHDALLQRVGQERHDEADAEQGRYRADEADAARFQSRQLALAGEPLQRQQRPEQHRHRHDRHDDLRHLP